MTKPIFITITPESINQHDFAQGLASIERRMGEDYHCLLIRGRKDDWEFKVLNGDDIEDKDLEEIKEMITKINNNES